MHTLISPLPIDIAVICIITDNVTDNSLGKILITHIRVLVYIRSVEVKIAMCKVSNFEAYFFLGLTEF